jgi:uncharacterized repeat protein (TIGR01451 family)
MKSTIFITLFTLISWISVGQIQDQNLTVTDARILPRPTTVGGTVAASFIFFAENGATLIPGEEMSISVCFNKITAASIENRTDVIEYETFGGATGGFINFVYDDFSGCLVGKITQSLNPGSGFKVTFDNLIVESAATPAQAGTNAGVGFSVNLVPHHRDPSNSDTDDFTQNYTYTSEVTTDLAITKVANNATPNVGENVTFTITATNNGPGNATGVLVNEALPSGYSFVSSNASAGTSYSAPTWTIGSLANGASATLTVVAKVEATGSYANTVTISGTETDPTPGNNTDTETPTPISTTDLAITKVANNATPNVGENVTFTITATNNGPGNATGVLVNEALPSGYSFVSSNASAGTSYNAPTWTIGSLANGASATLTVVATVNATGSYANTVTISGTETDPTPGNNTDTETPIPRRCPEGVRCLSARVVRN